MNALSIALLSILLLTLAGCGEQVSGSKNEAAVPVVAAKELTPEEKFAEMKREAASGDAKAQISVARMYYKGDGITKDIAKAAEWMQKAAVLGDIDAQIAIGWSYEVGEGVPKNIIKALEWYKKAAERGDSRAQFKLGEIYSSNDFIMESAIFLHDEAKAIAWYQKAAEQGYVDAQAKLGFNFWFGIFGKQSPSDYAKAFTWAQKAVENGDSRSKFVLGMLYLDGKGVRKDATKAFEWLHKAAEDGHVNSQGMVGDMYAKGEGVSKSAGKAFEWYLKAASNGAAVSQNSVGVSYQRGEGTSRDFVRAYAWYNLAAAQGDKYGKKNRDQIEMALTSTQRAEGQNLASNWKKGDTLQISSNSPVGSNLPNGKPSKQGTGTAFVVSSAGHALTNYHVINGCSEMKVAGREGIAKIITFDSVNDLALLQLPGKAGEIVNFNSDPGKLRQGEDIIVFGYPLNTVLSSGGNLTLGTISALTGLGNNTNQIQITAPIQPGSSGSPVMDKKGNVVGVVSMKLSDSVMAKATGQIG